MRFKFYKAMLKILFAALCTFLIVPDYLPRCVLF